MSSCRRPTSAPLALARARPALARARLALVRAPLALACALLAAMAASATAEPAPIAASSIAIAPAQVSSSLARLQGQRARVVADRLVIDDVAGEGRPWVGVIERHGDRLWLRTDGGSVVLDGPLARPRIAGPGYLAWATGGLTAGAPPTLRIRRLGILAGPAR